MLSNDHVPLAGLPVSTQMLGALHVKPLGGSAASEPSEVRYDKRSPAAVR